MKSGGFTLIEIIIVLAIFLIIGALALPVFHLFQKDSDLKGASQEVLGKLRTAQEKTLGSEGASQWGVYFDASASPNQYTLFKGASFDSRATSSDSVYKLPQKVSFSNIYLGGAKEVVFNRLTGASNQTGYVSLETPTGNLKTQNIYIESSGKIGLNPLSIPSDDARIKDSRIIQFDYARQISTSTEKLVLTFEGGVVQNVVIAENMKGGQIYWEGTVEVAGSNEILEVHTLRLNDLILGTLFCVHRDGRFNDKSLTIGIDGSLPDPDPGTLLSYSGQGSVFLGDSIYVSNLKPQ